MASLVSLGASRAGRGTLAVDEREKDLEDEGFQRHDRQITLILILASI
jgi:hypothetical protein